MQIIVNYTDENEDSTFLDIAVVEHNTNINDVGEKLEAIRDEKDVNATLYEEQVMEKDVGTSQTYVFVSKGTQKMMGWEILINDYRAQEGFQSVV